MALEIRPVSGVQATPKPDDNFGKAVRSWCVSVAVALNGVIAQAAARMGSPGGQIIHGGAQDGESLILSPNRGQKGGNVLISNLRLANMRVPSSSSATGMTGEIAWNGTSIFVCCGTNKWRKTDVNAW